MVPRRRFIGLTIGAAIAPWFARGNTASAAAIAGANATSPVREPDALRSIDDVRALLGELLSERFPELARVPIRVVPYDDEPYYLFEARPDDPFSPIEKGGLIIRVNRASFDVGYPREIVKAVLAHELSHGIWYLERGAGAAAAGLISFLLNRTSFEKATDLEAIRRGYGPGLAAHRRFILERFPERANARTGKYLAAEEIERAMQDPNDPLWKIWSAEFQPPPPRPKREEQRD